MKRYSHLFEKVCEMDNLRLAHKNAQKGKKHYREVKKVNKCPERYLREIQRILKAKEYSTSKYETVVMKTSNGKVRTISKLPYFPDRIIQHAIMQITEPLWFKTLIRDTYSAIKGRGVHDGVRRLIKSLKDKSSTIYCLKLDIKKYYPSINNNILKKVIRQKIKDKDLLWLLDDVIDASEGVPIGNYLSQYFGNLYLSEFDHWMKEKQKIKHYFRYCDDVVVLHSDKAFLHSLYQRTERFLDKTRDLCVKENWQIFPVEARGIDFLGYVFYHDYTLLRKSIKMKFRKKISTIKRRWKAMSAETVINSVMSYYGWLKHANCKNLFNKYLDDNIYWIVKQKAKEIGIKNPLMGIR